MLLKILMNSRGITIDSVAYRLMPATVAQVMEKYSFQFYLFSLIACKCPLCHYLKDFFCPFATLQSKRHYLLQKVLQEVILFAKMCLSFGIG